MIGLLEDGDKITIDAVKNKIHAHLSDEEIADRRNKFQAPAISATSGILRKYSKTVSSASEGCVTDEL